MLSLYFVLFPKMFFGVSIQFRKREVKQHYLRENKESGEGRRGRRIEGAKGETCLDFSC